MTEALQNWNCARGAWAVAGLALALALASCSTPVSYVSAPKDAADAVVCGRCGGTGAVYRCPQCDGAGQTMRNVPVVRESTGSMRAPSAAPGREVRVVPCLACSGSGARPGTPQNGTSRVCGRCSGTGRVYRCDASGKRLPAP